MHLMGYAMEPRRLAQHELRIACGRMLYNRGPKGQLYPHEVPELTPVNDIGLGHIPQKPIIKMMKSDHAKMLVDHGRIRLGSLLEFSLIEKAEVGDDMEGLCILAAYHRFSTHILKARTGLNNWVFCAYEGDPSTDLLDRFGYDTAVEISDVGKFGQLIANALGASTFTFASCVYRRHKVLVGESLIPINPSKIGAYLGEILGNGRTFIKPFNFSHQNEFRFSWTMPSQVSGFNDIICPEIRSLCKIV